MKIENKKQYSIKNFATTTLIKEICKELGINQATYYRKARLQIGQSGGFYASELLKISRILNRPVNELITSEAKSFYLTAG